VDEAPDFFAAQGRDYALDLSPMAEARDVPVVPAALGACRGFISRVVAEALHQLGSVGKGKPSVNERRIHETSVTARPLR